MRYEYAPQDPLENVCQFCGNPSEDNYCSNYCRTADYLENMYDN